MGGRASLVLPERAALLSPFCSLCGEEGEAPGAAGPSSCPGVFSVAGAAPWAQWAQCAGGHTRVLARGTAWAGPGKLWTVIIKINLPITPLGA